MTPQTSRHASEMFRMHEKNENVHAVLSLGCLSSFCAHRNVTPPSMSLSLFLFPPMCPRVLLAARSQRLRPLLFLLPAPNHPARHGRTLVLHKVTPMPREEAWDYEDGEGSGRAPGPVRPRAGLG